MPSEEVKWALLRQRHYKLRRYIEDRACTLGKEVIRVTEYYTTKECGKCGKRNDTVGGKVTFKCVDLACGATNPTNHYYMCQSTVRSRSRLSPPRHHLASSACFSSSSFCTFLRR